MPAPNSRTTIHGMNRASAAASIQVVIACWRRPHAGGGVASDVRPSLAAVDGNARAADPARPRRSQPRHGVAHFLGPPEPPERELAGDEVGDAGRIGLL